MPDPDGLLAGRYRLVHRIAVGGMSTVWQGWDERLQRPVAVKQLLLQPGLSPEDAQIAIQRTMREARITARLHHPNAVEVLDVVDDDGHPSLVMQYEPSRSLQAIVREEGPLPPDQVARLGTQIAAALAAAHRVGVVHRDVKPGNVLITDDGVAKLTDFGISHAHGDMTLTSTGMMTGTPAYLAPEIARGATSSPSSDVFALGATLYMALEGEPPFGTEKNAIAMLHRVAAGVINPPKHTGPLADLLRRMMAADPAARPSTVEVANALASVHDGAVASASEEPTSVMDVPRGGRAQSVADEPRTIALPPVRPTAAADSAGSSSERWASPPPVLPPVPGPDEPDEPSHERRGTWIAVIAALAVAGLAAVLALVLLTGGGSSPSAAGRQTSSAPATHSATSPATSPAPSHSRSRSSSRPAPSTSTTPPPKPSTSTSVPNKGPATSSQLTQAIVDYFTIVPGDLDTGWQRLTPHFQDVAGGRSNYNTFWGGIDRVETSDAIGQPPHTVTVTLTYYFKDGRVQSDRTVFTLKRMDGVLKIDGESVQ